MTSYLIDARALGDESAVRGIGTYVRGLLSGYSALGVAGDVGLLLERGTAVPASLAATGFAVHPSRLRPVGRHLRPLLDPLQVRMALTTNRPALYHAVDYAQPVAAPVPVVLTVHDLIPFLMPHAYPWMRRERLLPLRQFCRADAVIAVSRSTADDVQRLAAVDPARISVIPEGVAANAPLSDADLAQLRTTHGLPERFVLAVGTFDPRKRIDLLVDVVRRLRASHDVDLVIAGFQGNFAEVVEANVRRAGLSNHTHLLGYVRDDDLRALYQMADCLLHTSAYEGFGLPPLEAMASGTATVAFDNSSLPEVIGSAGVLVPDGDVAAMADAAGSLLSNGRHRERLARSGRERAAMFTWERAATATLAVYRRVLDSR